MGHPNGIWYDNDRLIVNTLGSGKLFSIDSAGQRTALPKPPAGGLDGLVRLKKTGDWLFQAGEERKVYRAGEQISFSGGFWCRYQKAPFAGAVV